MAERYKSQAGETQLGLICGALTIAALISMTTYMLSCVTETQLERHAERQIYHIKQNPAPVNKAREQQGYTMTIK